MLDTRPARTDLTDRECTKIIGGLLGGLSQMTDLATLRRAVQWWASSDKSWQILEVAKGADLIAQQHIDRHNS